MLPHGNIHGFDELVSTPRVAAGGGVRLLDLCDCEAEDLTVPPLLDDAACSPDFPRTLLLGRPCKPTPGMAPTLIARTGSRVDQMEGPKN